jgi:hypothetical protein
MKMHCLLVGIIGTGLLMLTPDAVAHGALAVEPVTDF